MDIKNIPEHELARLREKAKELSGSTTDYQSEYSSLLTRRVNHEPLQYIEEYVPFYSISLKVDERCSCCRCSCCRCSCCSSCATHC